MVSISSVRPPISLHNPIPYRRRTLDQREYLAKEQREREKKEELTEKLQEIGEIWKTPDEVDGKVTKM